MRYHYDIQLFRNGELDDLKQNEAEISLFERQYMKTFSTEDFKTLRNLKVERERLLDDYRHNRTCKGVSLNGGLI